MTRPTKFEGAIFRAQLRRTSGSWQASYVLVVPQSAGGQPTSEWGSDTATFSTDKAATKWLSTEAQALGFQKEEIEWKH